MFGKKIIKETDETINSIENVIKNIGDDIEHEIIDTMRVPDDILGRHSANVKADLEKLSIMIDNLTTAIRILTNELEQATIAHEALNDAFIKMNKSVDNLSGNVIMPNKDIIKDIEE